MIGVTKPYGDVTSITILNDNVTHIQKYYLWDQLQVLWVFRCSIFEAFTVKYQNLRVTSQVLQNLMFFIKCISKPYCDVTHIQKYYLWDQL